MQENFVKVTLFLRVVVIVATCDQALIANLHHSQDVSKKQRLIARYQPAKASVSPSLYAAGDVSRGGTSATQRQKFHTDDVKSPTAKFE